MKNARRPDPQSIVNKLQLDGTGNQRCSSTQSLTPPDHPTSDYLTSGDRPAGRFEHIIYRGGRCQRTSLQHIPDPGDDRPCNLHVLLRLAVLSKLVSWSLTLFKVSLLPAVPGSSVLVCTSSVIEANEDQYRGRSEPRIPRSDHRFPFEMQGSAPRAGQGTDSPGEADKPSRAGRWRRAIKRKLSFLVPRRIFRRRRRHERNKGRGQNTVGPVNQFLQTGDPKPPDGNRCQDDAHHRHNEHQEQRHGTDPYPDLIDAPDTGNLDTSHDTDPLSSSSRSGTASLAIFSPNSPVVSGSGTDQKTPFRQPEQSSPPLPLDNDDRRSQTSTVRSSSQANLTLIPSNGSYKWSVYMIREDASKESFRMALDTQSATNLLCVEAWRELRLELHPYTDKIIPLQCGEGEPIRMKPKGIVKNVAWHFAGGKRTYVSDFVVLDMPRFDAILGNEDINRWRILQPGPGLEARHAVVRDLSTMNPGPS
ncbi:hypothetical protein BO70DRAFT_395830 [Aspergillus heteromorphus CBS 117.55]|uniref:Uncharacterized protein n=1 Tax=Aspergillus heteromorphus CBS 117.55 TaxID=1448321 RepID=A0A317WAI7_9EURO|nr:uncharacterized protein BO70DRAFT_395830 [Aspergillus heteromorphus CBS 117.55]PWY83383.1 hypothetical protein BO70DRAFT_395830 [Aspergillus heteromorphus CBS 117.55]